MNRAHIHQTSFGFHNAFCDCPQQTTSSDSFGVYEVDLGASECLTCERAERLYLTVDVEAKGSAERSKTPAVNSVSNLYLSAADATAH